MRTASSWVDNLPRLSQIRSLLAGWRYTHCLKRPAPQATLRGRQLYLHPLQAQGQLSNPTGRVLRISPWRCTGWGINRSEAGGAPPVPGLGSRLGYWSRSHYQMWRCVGPWLSRARSTVPVSSGYSGSAPSQVQLVNLGYAVDDSLINGNFLHAPSSW